MKKIENRTKLSTISAAVLLVVLSGCSSSPSNKYDEVELIEYQACLSQVTTKAPSGFSGAYNEIDGMLEWCKSLRPLPIN